MAQFIEWADRHMVPLSKMILNKKNDEPVVTNIKTPGRVYNAIGANYTTITSFVQSETAPGEDVLATDVTDGKEVAPVYVWVDSSGTTAYWYSEADKIVLWSGLVMFNGATSLQTTDINKWELSENATSLASMFSMSGITSLDLSGWNTSTITDISNIFSSCRSLESLDINGWDLSNVINTENAFKDCDSLIQIACSEDTEGKLKSLMDTGLDMSTITYVRQIDPDLSGPDEPDPPDPEPEPDPN